MLSPSFPIHISLFLHGAQLEQNGTLRGYWAAEKSVWLVERSRLVNGVSSPLASFLFHG